VTEDDIAVLGAYAETVLTHPYFNMILNAWDQATVAMMLGTKPEQVAERERVFSSVNSVREFIAFMQDFVVQAHKQQEPPAVDDWDDPLVHDIYRLKD
jgi:hypothetical protein